MHRVRASPFSLLGLIMLAVLLAALVGTAGLVAQNRDTGRSGKEIYQAACASCHGADGRGAVPATASLPLPTPDFTSCSFVTRERGVDWHGIVQRGGPTRAFDRLMPAFGDALAEDEIDRVVKYTKAFCTETGWPLGELNFPRALVTEKAFPEDEVVVTTTAGTSEVSSKFIYEKRIGRRAQVEAIVPIPAAATDSGTWSGGIGDVAVGAKRVMYANRPSGTIFSLAGELILPTGNADKGFGKGTTVFEPFVAFGQRLPANLFVQVQSGVELPFDTEKAGQEAYVRLATGRSFFHNRFGRMWTPLLEVVGVRSIQDSEPIAWDVVPGLQVTLSTRQHVRAGLGVRVPASERQGRHTSAVVYLLWDWFDGPFLGGW